MNERIIDTDTSSTVEVNRLKAFFRIILSYPLEGIMKKLFWTIISIILFVSVSNQLLDQAGLTDELFKFLGLGISSPPSQPEPPVIDNPVPTAEEMLPDLAGYNQVAGQDLTQYVSALSEGAALLASRPDLAAALKTTDSISNCYQESGAVRGRAYSNDQEPLEAGAVVIGDRNQLLSLETLAKCILGPAAENQVSIASIEIEPCTKSYQLNKENNQFFIAYVGTTPNICQAFCSQLEGCEAAP